jgi:Nucleotidyltransferase of unknown function (DUF6036)
MPRDLAEPWRSFLTDLDALVTHEVRLHCCGGFVVTTRYGMARTTADLDVLSILPGDDQRTLAAAAGRGSELHKTHGICLDVVTVATYPDNYEDRLTEMHPGLFPKIRLLALDPYDLVLTKLTRNADRDRGDVEYLATAVPLDVSVLRDRYQREMRTYVGMPEREDLTLGLWIEIIEEAKRFEPPPRRHDLH